MFRANMCPSSGENTVPMRHLVFVTLCTGYTRKNGAVSKVNKKFISHLTRAQSTPSAAATVQVSHALPVVRFSCLLRGQFKRWRSSRERLSVCSVLRCPDLWLQCSVCFVHGLGKTHQKLTINLFLTLTGTTYTVSSSNCPSFSCATSSSLLILAAGPWGQCPKWRRSRKRLSVCSVLRCPDLRLQCSVSFVHRLEKTYVRLF